VCVWFNIHAHIHTCMKVLKNFNLQCVIWLYCLSIMMIVCYSRAYCCKSTLLAEMGYGYKKVIYILHLNSCIITDLHSSYPVNYGCLIKSH